MGRSGAATSQGLARLLHERGLRCTPQRERVLAAVREFGHVTPEELNEAIDGIDLTTIYRTLELFEQLGLVRHTHLGHGAALYRPAEDQHVHLVCHRCGRVTDMPADLIADLAARLAQQHAFELDPSHFTAFGRCAQCQQNPGQQNPGRQSDQARPGSPAEQTAAHHG